MALQEAVPAFKNVFQGFKVVPLGCTVTLTQTTLQVERKSSSRSGERHELGRRVANLLAGAWRDFAQTANRNPDLSEAELADIVPLLCESGAGALAWRRICYTPLANTDSGRQLQEVYRLFRLSALIHEREIAHVLSLLRAEDIEPVLVKGWAIARLYPDAALRPYGDIDLCIRPDQFAQASAALKCLEDINGHCVDLHCGFARIGQTRAQDTGDIQRFRRFKINQGDMRVWDDAFKRSRLVPLDKGTSKTQPPTFNVTAVSADIGLRHRQSVRILCDEDHLRLLSLHLLRSGVRRPTWLSDIALLLEARTKDFDWDVCLGQRSNRTATRNLNWLATTIGLAHQLLGADLGKIENTTLAKQARSLPRWVVPAVLCQWGRSRLASPGPNVQSHLSSHRRRIWDIGLWTNLINRFDNPVRSTAAVGGQFNNWPRLPYRLAELVWRLPEVPPQLQLFAEQFRARRVKVSRRVAAV